MLYFFLGCILVVCVLLLLREKPFEPLAPGEYGKGDFSACEIYSYESPAKLETTVMRLETRIDALLSQEGLLKAAEEKSELLWLIDNRNRILNEVAVLRRWLSAQHKTLPACKNGKIRVFAMTEELVRSSDGIIDEETLCRFVEGYRPGFEEIDCVIPLVRLQLLRELWYFLETDSIKERSDIVKNAVRSLICVDNINMLDVAENVLPAEKMLASDILYTASDEQTRAKVRLRVGELARKSGESEENVIALACKARDDNGLKSVLELLIGQMLPDLREMLGLNANRFSLKGHTRVYLLTVFALAAAFTATVFAVSQIAVTRVFTVIFAFFAAVTISEGIVNSLIIARKEPSHLPRLSKESTDVSENMTLVTLAVLLSNEKRVEEALDRLEEYFLGNRVKNAQFLLLGDFSCADTPSVKADEAMIKTVKNKIDELNEKYGGQFAAIIRPRIKSDNGYCGWERKRGAILQLVRFLKGHNENFLVQCGRISEQCAYILTLDADTLLPPDSLIKLMGCIAHPLNKRTKSGGYGLVQPRIGTSRISNEESGFTHWFAPQAGIDTYACAASEVYQDFFSCGSFCGKGIFSVDEYYKYLEDAIKPGTVLSHDLLEGEILKTGLAGDILLLDSFPDNYIAFQKRQARWTRGDFQLLPWVFKLKNISKWKLLSNMIRELFSFNICALLVLAIISQSGYIALLAIIAFFYPLIMQTASLMRAIFHSREKKYMLRDKARSLMVTTVRSALTAVFLPYDAFLQAKSAFLGLWRRLVSHKNLLQWVTAADARDASGTGGYYVAMISCPIIAAMFYFLCVVFNTFLITGFVVSLCWSFAPVLAARLSGKRSEAEVKLLGDENDALRLLAHRTLRFFLDSLLPEFNFLIPDNLQLKPYKGYAKRTSPTNIGFALCAPICGIKMHFLSPQKATELIEKQLDTVDKLERYNGHLYNWYEIESLQPLGRRYVSTVDSGNLCASLLLVSQAAKGFADESILDKSTRESIADALASACDEVNEDMILYLSNYADELYSAQSSAEAAMLLEKMEFDPALAGCVPAEYAVSAASEWFSLYRRMSFSKEIFLRIEEIEDINLRPLKEYLESFPKSVAKTLAEASGFNERVLKLAHGIERIEGLLISIGNEFKEINNCAKALNARFIQVSERCRQLALSMDFLPLFDKQKNMFFIGIDTESGKPSPHMYDLLCSEARLTGLVAIALGQIPAKHWFALSRPGTRILDIPTVLSWSGTMFEYLMPDIFISAPAASLLGCSVRGAVKAQIEYGREHGIPWGISESAFCAFDFNKEYKYKAFGVPRTALCSCDDEKVVSPYSTLLALGLAPREAMDNLIRLVSLGAAGSYGMYEAVDFDRLLSRKSNYSIAFSYMAHHQGMSLCSLVNYLFSDAVRREFLAVGEIAAVKTLLEERVPEGITPRTVLPVSKEEIVVPTEITHRSIIDAKRQGTQVQVLGNGSMSAVYTSTGASALALEDSAVTVLSGTRENHSGGSNLFVYDGVAGHAMGFLPCKNEGGGCSAELFADKCVFARSDRDVKMTATCFVAEDVNAEIRWVTLFNGSCEERELTVVLAHDVALTTKNTFTAHPAFNGLFIETKHLKNGLLAKNRKNGFCAGIKVIGSGTEVFQTDRLAFMGRGNTFPQEMTLGMGEGFVGVPVFPVLAAGRRVSIKPGTACELFFITAAAHDEEEISRILDGFMGKSSVHRAAELAASGATACINAFSISGKMMRVAEAIMLSALLRGRARCDKSGNPNLLYRFELSGEKPIVVFNFGVNDDLSRFSQALRIIDYVLSRNVKIDVLVIDDTAGDYLDGQFRSVEECISHSSGRICHIKTVVLAEGEKEQLENCACIVFSCANPLNEQLPKHTFPATKPFVPAENRYPRSVLPMPTGEFDCGYGVFRSGGSEYSIYAVPPVAWSNILCNRRFGSVCTSTGGGYSYFENSSLFKLTPWKNDPVADEPSECVYIIDNETKRFWSITSSPVNYGDDYHAGFFNGYCIYKYNGFGLAQTQTVFVHKELPVKIWTIEMGMTEKRDLSAAFFAPAVLGSNENESNRYLERGRGDDYVYVFRENKYMFLYVEQGDFCLSSGAFLGRNGSLRAPFALSHENFAPEDETFALGVKAKINNGRISIFMGCADSFAEMNDIIAKLRGANTLQWLEETKEYFEEKTGGLKIKTPLSRLDTMFNGRLLYQTLTSRMTARCGLYQAGGAFGFRDQLQDCLALMYTQPALVRRHILFCAAHQFEEGDVQHWFHPPQTGVRTLMSDDLLFLPFVASKYVRVTGDMGIFDEEVGYLCGSELGTLRDLYEAAQTSEKRESLYKHCLRAIDLCIRRTGEHGLPLIGGGDWSDGLNDLGVQGRGESVWLGWFVYSVISEMLPFCRCRNDEEKIKKYVEYSERLIKGIEEFAWDGKWYRRAFNDLLQPIGSAQNNECRIDAIAQSWATLSGGASGERAKTALNSMYKMLYDKKTGILKLLDPPFSRTKPRVGYIQDYCAGLRENGGQYTHAALWAAMAFAERGDSKRCLEMLDAANPITHTSVPAQTEQYKIEPYVVAADIYSGQQTGRGGWSWYTASSAMFFYTVVEYVIGLKFKNGKMHLDPCIPSHWSGFEAEYTVGASVYHIRVLNPDAHSSGVKLMLIDGKKCDDGIKLVDDGASHEIRAVM